jgi:hypothetical protein
MIRTRKLFSSIVLAMSLLAGGTTARAAPAADSLHTVTEHAAGFSIEAGQCKNLPDDLSVTGTGRGVTTVDITTHDDGSILLTVNEKVTGTAVGSDATQYTFYHYQYLSAVAAVAASDAKFRVYDLFLLQSKAAAANNTYVLRSGFAWRWTFDGNVDPVGDWPPANFQKVQTFGDPNDGPNEPHCDPVIVDLD